MDSKKTLNRGPSTPLDPLSLQGWTGSGRASVDVRTRPLCHYEVVETCIKLPWSKHYIPAFYYHKKMYKNDLTV